MKKELTKMEFKEMYMNYRKDGDGWSVKYWDQFYENQQAKQYFFTEPETPEHKTMFISESHDNLDLFFMALAAEESLFDYPGKE